MGTPSMPPCLPRPLVGAGVGVGGCLRQGARPEMEAFDVVVGEEGLVVRAHPAERSSVAVRTLLAGLLFGIYLVKAVFRAGVFRGFGIERGKCVDSAVDFVAAKRNPKTPPLPVDALYERTLLFLSQKDQIECSCAGRSFSGRSRLDEVLPVLVP
ncbi:unnamed protein product, partial [Scytosiphon promiscuus]